MFIGSSVGCIAAAPAAREKATTRAQSTHTQQKRKGKRLQKSTQQQQQQVARFFIRERGLQFYDRYIYKCRAAVGAGKER